MLSGFVSKLKAYSEDIKDPVLSNDRESGWVKIDYIRSVCEDHVVDLVAQFRGEGQEGKGPTEGNSFISTFIFGRVCGRKS